MAWVLNNTERLIHLGGVGLSPGVPAEVEDDWGTNERVKEMMEAGDLETVSGPELPEDAEEHKRQRTERRDARIEGREERKLERRQAREA